MKLSVKLTLLIGCLATAISASNLPISRQATFKENYSPSEVTIQATGLGRRDADALIDMRKAAVHFVLYGGTDPLLNTQEARAAFEQRQESFFDISNIMQYITWEASRITTTAEARIPGERRAGVSITKDLRVNISNLRTWLEENNIISSRAALVDAIGLPFIMVIPEVPEGQNPLQVFEANSLARQAAGAIESHLTSRRFDVVVPRAQEQLSNLAQIQGALKGGEEDIMYQLALSLGADIYITFTGQVQNNRATVVVKAYETTTARLLGTETGYSEARPGASQQALVEEAINGAITNVISRMQAYWIDDANRGSQYKLLIQFLDNFDRDEAEDIQFEIMDALDDMFSTVRENVVTSETLDYLVWATQDDFRRSSNIYRHLRRELRDVADITQISINRKFIHLGVKHRR